MIKKISRPMVIALCSLMSLCALAQAPAEKPLEYRNEHFGIWFKYAPGFVIDDKSTDADLSLIMKYKSLSESYSIKTIPALGTDLGKTAQIVYDFFKKGDGDNKALSKYYMSPIDHNDAGIYTFLETFDIDGVSYEGFTMIKEMGTPYSQGVMMRVQYEKPYASSVPKTAILMFVTIHKMVP